MLKWYRGRYGAFLILVFFKAVKKFQIFVFCCDFVRQGPVFPDPLVTPSDVSKLNATDAVKRLKYVGDAITLTRHTIDGKVPLIGFSGAPVSKISFQKKKTFFLQKNLYFTFKVDTNGLYD